MPTLLYEHLLQHGEKTVLQLRRQLAFFLACELSPVCASAVRRPEDDEQKPQQPEKTALCLKKHPTHHYGSGQENKNEQGTVLTQTEGDRVSHIEEKQDGRCESSVNLVREDLPTGPKEEQQLPAAQKDGAERRLVSDVRGRSDPLAKSEEAVESYAFVEDMGEEKESKLLRCSSSHNNKRHQELPASSSAPPSAEQQFIQPAAGKDAVAAEAQAPVAGGKEDRPPSPATREQKRHLSSCAGAELKVQEKPRHGEPRTTDRKTLATFLASSSSELSELLKALFLLECLPPEPFVNMSESSLSSSTHQRSSTRGDAVQQAPLRSKNHAGGANAALVESLRLVQEETGVLLHLLPKASVLSHLLKDVGNTLFAQRQLDAARCTYTASLQVAPLCAAGEQLFRSFQGVVDHEAEQAPSTGHCLPSTPRFCSVSYHGRETAAAPSAYRQHVAVLLGNRSALHLKQQAPVAALRDATAALQVDPTYLKAWFRRGMALLLLADLLHTECRNQGSAPAPSAALQCQNQDTAVLQGRKSMPSFPSPHAPAASHAASTAAADAQGAAFAACSNGGGHVRSKVAEANTCCFIVERLLREEAAYSLARSAPGKSASGSVRDMSSLMVSSPLSSVAASTAAAASSCRSSTSSAADGLTPSTASGPPSCPFRSSPSPSVLSTAKTLAWSEAHAARDGEGNVFQLGVCPCEATEEEQLQHVAAVGHGKTKEAQESGARKKGNKDFSTGAAVTTKRNWCNENGSSSAAAAAAAGSAGAPSARSPGSFKARGGELAESETVPSEAALGDSGEPQGEKREALETSVCSGASRTAAKSTKDKRTPLTPRCNVGRSGARKETCGTRGGEKASGAAAHQRKAENYRTAHETKPAAPKEKSAGASAARSVDNADAQAATAAVAAVPPLSAPQPTRNASATPEREGTETLPPNPLDSFVVYIHPDVETRTDGPLGTSVHWRQKLISGEQGEAPFEPRTENQPCDAGLVLEEYPVAAYCAPKQNAVLRAALPVVQGKRQFLQHWKHYVQKEHAPKARAVCAGCFKPVGAHQQQLEGVELVRALYRHCRLVCRTTRLAAQGKTGGRNAESEQANHRSVASQDGTSVHAGGERMECDTGKVDDAEQQMTRRCRRLLCHFLASVELVAPCSTCSAALFCCPRCRDASHHVAVCGGRIGVRRGRCKEKSAVVPGSACNWSSMWKHNSASLEECASQHSPAYGKSQGSMDAGVSTGSPSLKKTSSYAEEQVPTRGGGSSFFRNDADAGKQLRERENVSTGAVLTASLGMLGATSALASLVATAFNGSTSLREGETDPRLPAACAPTSEPAQPQASTAAGTFFGNQCAEYFNAVHQLRAAVSQHIERGVPEVARVCATARENQDSRSGFYSQHEDSAAALHDTRLQDLSAVYSVHENCLGLQRNRYDRSSVQQSRAREESCSSTNPESGGSALHSYEFPVAYTAGGALDDGARHLARQIFPHFLSRAPSFAGRYDSGSHPVTRLAAHLPADAERLCDTVVNAMWLAGEYFSKAAFNTSGMEPDLWSQADLQDTSRDAVMQKRSPACVSDRAGVRLKSGPHDAASVREGLQDKTDRWKHKTGAYFSGELAVQEYGEHLGSDVGEAEQEDVPFWAWLRSPEVWEAALAAYGVVCSNSFATSLQQDETGGWIVGRALYLFASQFNHSCSPNTMAIFDADFPCLTANDAKKEFLCGWRSPRNVESEREQCQDYLKKQHRVYRNAALGPRRGCALKLRYYGCRERRDEDTTAANGGGKDGKWWRDQVGNPVCEELTVSYTAVAGGKRDTWWYKRRQFLRQEALFDCRCVACVAWMSFLATIRTAGPRGLPRLFPLLPDHLQNLPCPQCYSRDSTTTQPKTSPGAHRSITQMGVPRDLCEADALCPVAALLSTRFQSRSEAPTGTYSDDDLAGGSRRIQRPFVAQNVSEDVVVALRGGFLLLESIRDGLVAAGQEQRVRRRGEKGTSCTKSRGNAGAASPCGPHATLQHRVTSTASLAALGHSLLPRDDKSFLVEADLHGVCRAAQQPRDPESSDIHHCDMSLETSHVEESDGIMRGNVSSASSYRSPSKNGGARSGRNSGTSGLHKGMIEIRSDLESHVSSAAHCRFNDSSSCSSSCAGVAGRNQSTTSMCCAGTGQLWVCIHCGFTDKGCDVDTPVSGNPDMEAIRCSIETSLRLCNEVPDPMKRGKQLLHHEKLREVQLRNLLVHMAQTRGQLSHEVCTALDIWAMWATECAAIASDAESELCTVWCRANSLQSVEGSAELRGKAVAELGAKLAEFQERCHSLAFRLHLGATWVHSVRFSRSWKEPELCTELYKSAVLAGNAGRVREGMLLAKAAEYSGTAAYGPGHPLVHKIRELLTSLEHHGE